MSEIRSYQPDNEPKTKAQRRVFTAQGSAAVSRELSARHDQALASSPHLIGGVLLQSPEVDAAGLEALAERDQLMHAQEDRITEEE